MTLGEGIFLGSALAFALTWCMMRVDVWCARTITNHERSLVIWWAFMACAIIFTIVVSCKTYLELTQ